ncbi:MAG: methyltransferase domain-containing protein [Verrucomicrobia bacterium]|nr:methyltransferase domain-containing protein [Verrucomicrobiota bacterium]
MDDKKKPPSRPQPKAKNGRGPGKTLGPVPDLEVHVPSDWWSRIFNSMYLKTDADVVHDARITRAEVDVIADTLKLSPDDKVFDLCCGQGRHVLELARRGFKSVEGLDRSHYLVTKARETAKNEGLTVRFKEGDARKLPYRTDKFDVVLILGNSFGYFDTLNDDLQVLREVRRVLKPWGRLLVDVAHGDWLREHFQARSWEWLSNKLFVCRERSLSRDGDRLVSREVITHVEKGVIADQFYAERLYSIESLSKLLTGVGFSNVTAVQEIASESARAQDLGMMERRILVTAQVKKEWAPQRRKPKPEERHVVVLQGDPRKPDPLKPRQVFDDDDLYTIDQMKDALRQVSGYRFTFLDNHDTLIQDLAKLVGKADLVLNLCDEGFTNNPRLELHVPSVLEMLGLPYTGGGPQCLAFCYDKSLVRGAAKEMGIPVPEAMFVRPEDTRFELPFDFPVIVKPDLGDSSFGITQHSVAYTAEELLNAIQIVRQQFGYEKPLLVEEFLTGKDLSVGIIGTPPSSYFVLPITEEDYSSVPPELPRICGYEAKWDPDSPYWGIKSLRAELPPDTEKAIVEWCVALSERLECRDYARFDWRLDAAGTPKLLEVNPNPGWCWDGHLAKMAAHAGISYSEMLGAILRAAEDRITAEQADAQRARGESDTVATATEPPNGGGEPQTTEAMRPTAG